MGIEGLGFRVVVVFIVDEVRAMWLIMVVLDRIFMGVIDRFHIFLIQIRKNRISRLSQR